ncbi:MAG: sulfate permease [Tumebacillaceae bacterium]
MLTIFRMEWKRTFRRWQWLVSFLLMIAFLVAGMETYFDPVHPSSFEAILYAIGKGANALFPGIFPLAIALFAGSSLAWDRKTGYRDYILLRTTYKRYIGSKLLAAALAGFTLTVATELLAFLYAVIRYPTFSFTPDPDFVPGFLPGLYLTSPTLYVFGAMLIVALAAVFVGLFSVVISTMIKNIYIVIAVPWLLFLLLQFFLYIINGQHYAPLDLIGLYMIRRNYGTLEVPMYWVGLSVIMILITYAVYTVKYRTRRQG